MKGLKLVLLAAAVAVIGGGLYVYWQHTAAHPSSDDSYLQAGILNITPQVSGTVVSVGVVENQHVQQGDTLFVIDSVALEAAKNAAVAQLDQARQADDSGAANVVAAQAQLTLAQADLAEAQKDFDRQQSLATDGVVSTAALDQAHTALDTATSGVQTAQAALDAAIAEHGPAGDNNPGIREAEANLALATFNLSHATVTAPASGWVSNIDLLAGQYVLAGQSQFSIVADDGWWIEANFKETDLTRIRPGMPATISVDMYPSLALQGVVDSIGAGSGASFSLLPAQNATGNWVKVTQRFPVRIRLTNLSDDTTDQLRVGASTTVTIDTTTDGSQSQ